LHESQLPLLPQQRESSPVYYRDAAAVAMVLAAAAIRLAFLSAMGMRAPFVTFYPAVIFASIYGGLRAGLLATALSAIVVDYFWIEPVGQFYIGQTSDWLAIMTFLLTGAMTEFQMLCIALASVPPRLKSRPCSPPNVRQQPKHCTRLGRSWKRPWRA
ncbi:MAG: DUF4118 domain-containing protein, partial [Syntrophales bacterium]